MAKGGKKSKGLPNLEDLRKTIPKKGLLDPSLRKDMGKLKVSKIPKGFT